MTHGERRRKRKSLAPELGASILLTVALAVSYVCILIVTNNNSVPSGHLEFSAPSASVAGA